MSAIAASSQLIIYLCILVHNSTPVQVNLIFPQDWEAQDAAHGRGAPSGERFVQSKQLSPGKRQIGPIPAPHVDPDRGPGAPQSQAFTHRHMPLMKWQKQWQ